MTAEQAMEITVQDLDGLRQAGAAHIILDVRNPPEIAICAIVGSTNIPMQEVPANLDRLSRKGALVVICHSGMRSHQVTAWLRQNGFDNAVNLRGGIDSWAREIDTSMAVY
jgi:rhodanese-related sulfurtransferase